MEILFQEQKLRVLSDNFSECNDKTFLQHLAKVDTFGIYKLIFHTFWQQAVAVLVARSENLCFPLLIWWHKVRGSQSVSHFYQRSGLSSGEKTCLLLSADTVSSTSNGALEKLWNRNIVLDVLPLLVFSTKTIAEVAELLCVWFYWIWSRHWKVNQTIQSQGEQFSKCNFNWKGLTPGRLRWRYDCQHRSELLNSNTACCN